MKISSGSVKPESTIKTSTAAFFYWKAAVLVFELPKGHSVNSIKLAN